MTTAQTTQTRRERRLAQRAARHDARGRRRPARRIGLGTISVLGVAGGFAAVVLAIALGARPASAPADATSVSIARVPATLASDGFALGRADAPVTVDLYEDFQCPACQTWGEGVFPSLAANELAAGTVRIVFHDMAFLGPESAAAGRAGFAAAQQGRFWDMWATLYANQGRENSGAFGRDRLIAMAQELGFDVERFAADMASSAAEASIAQAQADAARAGVTSTPTLVIDGRAFVGVQPYPEIADAIASAAR
jgi:protein-disulfide isomerase